MLITKPLAHVEKLKKGEKGFVDITAQEQLLGMQQWV